MSEIKILIAPPGAGKTTWAMEYLKEHPDDTVHISSDDTRKKLFGDETCQDDPCRVFGTMCSRAADALKNGFNVIYDATDMTRKSRRQIIGSVPKGTTVIAQIIWRSPEKCIEADKERTRTVGEHVIDRMIRSFQAPYYDEGFDKIDWHLNVSDSFLPAEYYYHILKRCDIHQDNPHHSLTVVDHNIAVRNYLSDIGADIELLIAGGLHDVGKPYVKDFHNAKGEPTEIAHYYGHQGYSAWLSIPCLTYPLWQEYDTKKICWLISNHMEPYMNTKYYKNLPPELKAELDLLHEADEHAK